MSTSMLTGKKIGMLALLFATSLSLAACTPASKMEVSPTPVPSALPAASMVPDTSEAPGEQGMQDELSTLSDASDSSEMGVVDPVTKVRTISIEAGSFYFKPDMIKVKKGEKVKLVMKSVDMMHDFNIDELKVKVPVTKSGAIATAEFTATTAGTFEYYCSVGQHRANGQVGTLIVE